MSERYSSHGAFVPLDDVPKEFVSVAKDAPLGATWLVELRPDELVLRWEYRRQVDALNKATDAQMTANPDSALRQALVAAEKALEPFVKVAGHWDLTPRSRGEAAEHWIIYESNNSLQTEVLTLADIRRAREAHALITEALQRGEK